MNPYIESGIDHYIYLYSLDKSLVLNSSNGIVSKENKIKIKKGMSYLHVAAVDCAGNVGPTVSFRNLITRQKKPRFMFRNKYLFF